VLVAEDSRLVREGVVRLLERASVINVVAVCQDLRGLLEAVETARPDVVVTDIRMPPTGTDEGIEAALRLRSSHPGLGVVVLSQYDEPEYVLRFLDAGSDRRAYLLKDRLIHPDHLLAAIQTVAEGGSVIDPRVVETLVRARSRDQASPLWSLTRREREVLQLMAEGGNNDAIAAELFLSVRVIEKHINAIFSKLGLREVADLHHRVKAVLIYLARDDE
jgi:DNA-binding NarL/FixJ family response regulator